MIEIPEGVTVDISGFDVTVKGPKGSVTKRLAGKVDVEKEGNKVVVKGSEKKKALVGTVSSLINNMIHGVTEGYTKHLKVLYAHFPVTMEVKENKVLIKNFIGEKYPRKAKITGDETKVEVKGQEVKVSGPDKEAVGQTVANIKSALKIRKKDRRIFQDGIYEVIE